MPRSTGITMQTKDFTRPEYSISCQKATRNKTIRYFACQIRPRLHEWPTSSMKERTCRHHMFRAAAGRCRKIKCKARNFTRRPFCRTDSRLIIYLFLSRCSASRLHQAGLNACPDELKSATKSQLLGPGPMTNCPVPAVGHKRNSLE